MKMKGTNMKHSFAPITSLVYCVIVNVPSFCLAGEAVEARVVRHPAAAEATGHYTPNRAPLAPTMFMKLPLGSIAPRGWLRGQLELDAVGIPGRLEEISQFLKFDNCGWVNPDKFGYEELPYWLRGYLSLAYTLQDEKLIAHARKWVEAIIATRQPDGFFGPKMLRSVEKGKTESFPHMCVIYALCSYYEATGDRRALDLVAGFYRWLGRQPELYFKTGWGGTRWSEHLHGIYWTYNRTGEPWLLELAQQIHQRTADWTTTLPTAHNVNFAQGFREPGEFWLQAKDRKLLDAVEEHYRRVMDVHGQFPGGGFAGDEGRRPGFVDPRQGFETCGFIEFMLSDEIMTRISGDPIWSDRCEEIAFNSLPTALTPDHRGLHYITSANSVELSKTGKKLGQFGNGDFPMQAYGPSPHGYRCCPHNYGMAWPYFTESLWLATADRGLCVSLYAPCEVKAKVADGTEVAIVEETDYPFGDQVTLRLSAPRAVNFPLWLRVPGWCEKAAVKINGAPVEVETAPKSYIILGREWHDGDIVTLQMPMRVAMRTWPRNRNAVSVDYGPLTFSLAIREKWTRYGPEKNPAWPGSEVFAESPWNYGLVADQKFEVVRKPGPLAANPFAHDGVPISMLAKARRIPSWQADVDGVVGPLQQSPARTCEPVEDVTLVPMGAARLRITSFPTVTEGSDGHVWQAPPRCVAKAAGSFAELPWMPQVLFYGIEPASSHDQTVPRFTWWNHKGSREWFRYKLPKPVRVSAVAVYWFDDQGQKDWYAGSGEFAVPKSWSLEYNDGNTWRPATPTGEFGTARDRYNRVEFTPVVTAALRLMVQLHPQRSAGLYAWKVFDGQTQLVPTTSAAAEQMLATGVAMPAAEGAAAAETWLKPELLSDIKDGRSIALWRDDAGGCNDARASSPDTAPTLVRNAIRGHAVAHFDAAKKQSLAFARCIEDDFAIAVVFRSQQGVGTARGFFQGAALVQGEIGGETDDFGISLNAKGEVLAGTGQPDRSIASPPGVNDGKPHLAVFTRIKAAGALTLFVDGKQVATGKGGTQSLTAPERLFLGADRSNHNHFTGDIGEVVLYTHALHDAQRKSLEQQLLVRWGIEALQSDSPKAAAAAVAPTPCTPLDFQYTEGQTAPRNEVRDPCIIREGDTYYLVFTMYPFRNRDAKHFQEPNQGGSPGIALYSSRDLKAWKFENWLVKSADLPETCPYKNRFWAPEIHEHAGKFYLIFTADNWLKNEYNPAGRWGSAGWAFVGVADKITGPYEHITWIRGAGCDTTLFGDSDGRTYAFIPRGDIDVQEIDLAGIAHGEVKLLGKPQRIVAADNSDIGVAAKPEYLEGPWVEKIGAKYCLFYAEIYRDKHFPDWLGYWTGVAYADTPLGPWKKDTRGKIFLGGHLAVFEGPDNRKWFSYRGESSDAAHGTLCIAPVNLEQP
jgi:hypothetical protein